MKKIILFWFIFLIPNNFIFSQIENVPGLSSIKGDNLLKIVSTLASEKYAGRLAGSEGYNQAADYVKKIFEQINLNPIINKGYYQFLNVEYNEILPPCKLKLINDKASEDFKLGDDFVCRGFTGSGTLTSQVVFCGYGVSLPQNNYDDYKNVDVKDKVVIVFKTNPAWTLPEGSWSDNHPRYKALIASLKGAKALLIVSAPNEVNPQKPIGSILEGKTEQLENIPMMHISIDAANKFLDGTGYTLSQLQSIIDSTKQPFSVELKSKAYIEIHAKYTKEKQTMNVVGLLPGYDDSLKDEYIVVGAHLDHVGSQAGEIYFPGANDNASGSAAVIEIAKAFMNSGIKTKRSIIFVLFASEEIGLDGARHFVNNSPVPLDKIIAMFNFDCVGVGDSIQIGNGKSSPKLWNIAKEKDSQYTKLMIESTWNGGGADAGPFHEKGIPALYFVTKNSYQHLHLPSDKPETLNLPLFENISRLGYLTLLEIANGNYVKEVVLK